MITGQVIIGQELSTTNGKKLRYVYLSSVLSYIRALSRFVRLSAALVRYGL